MSRNMRAAQAFAAIGPNANDKLLIINSTDPQLAVDLCCVDHQQFSKPIHDYLITAGVHLVDQLQGGYDLVLVNITKSKDETIGLIALGYTQLRDGGVLIINGDKTLGIERHYKALRKHYDDVSTALSKAHGKVFWLIKSAENADLADGISKLGLHENLDGFISTPGCFSAGYIDQGSAQLVKTIPANLTGHLADFGGGWGYLSHEIAAQNPNLAQIDLFESYAPALDCASRNITDSRVKLHWADVTQLNGYKFDTIVSNPPFHQGRQADLRLGQDFIKAAARNLGARGSFFMVANRQLAYESTLTDFFKSVTCLTQDQGFKTIQAQFPR